VTHNKRKKMLARKLDKIRRRRALAAARCSTRIPGLPDHWMKRHEKRRIMSILHRHGMYPRIPLGVRVAHLRMMRGQDRFQDATSRQKIQAGIHPEQPFNLVTTVQFVKLGALP
jgi:hypothetical protein